jgi:triosephosphate isomerase
MRIPIIAGNWKLHNTIEEALSLVKGIHYGLPWPGEVEVVVAPPFTALSAVADFLKDSYIRVAAQDVFWEEKGAYTGEISGTLLKDVAVDYVIIGHSERRQYFGETDETVNRKVKSALRNQLIPIICVGETLAQREAGQVEAIISDQVGKALEGLTAEAISNVVIAYEPIWAIGTGQTATPEQAESVHALIRATVRARHASPPILYGGSVKPSNSKEILAQPNIDGALVGGASLKPEDFIEIIKNTSP